MANKIVGGQKAHALFSPSAASRWVNCPGSIELSKSCPPSPDNAASIEGTQAHECLETFFKKLAKDNKRFITLVEVEKALKKKFPADMVEDARKAFLELQNHIPKGAEVLVEEKVDISHFTTENQFGTIDLAVLEDFGTLKVIDYKYGFAYVDPKENLQLICYALGLFGKYSSYFFEEIELAIMQPRNGGFRSWKISPEKLLEYEETLEEAARLALTKHAPVKAGEWCKWCPAKIKCPEVSSKALIAAQADFADDFTEISAPPASGLDMKKLGKILPQLDFLESWIGEVRLHAFKALERGEKVPGYKLVEKRGVRKYIDAAKVKKEAVKAFGKLALSEPELLSPAQLEKALNEQDFDGTKWVNKRTSNVSSGFTMVKEDDKRDAAVPIELEFSDMTKPKKGNKK